jgi:transposase
MATTATTRVKQETAFTPTLFLAFELGVHTWTLGFTTGAAQRPRERHVPAGDGQTVLEELRRAKSRLGLPAEARGVRGDEAGREGLWLHRFFRRQGVENSVVDAASLEVNRRDRRAKTARLDGHKRRTRRLRHTAGAKQVWRVVRGPSVGDADRRQRHRERLTTQRARPRVIHRSKGRLAGDGMRLALPGEVEPQREAVRPWDGAPWPTAWRARLQREGQQVQGLTEQRGSLETERRAEWRPRAEGAMAQVRPWATLRGSGGKSAGRFVRACLAWRAVQTPKQGGA